VISAGTYADQLYSHATLGGCVRPIRYIKLVDENNLSTNEYQRLCHNMSGSYARSTSMVSVAPAVAYADQVCTRTRLHLIQKGDEWTLPKVNEKHTVSSLPSWRTYMSLCNSVEYVVAIRTCIIKANDHLISGFCLFRLRGLHTLAKAFFGRLTMTSSRS
jgi:hypothetical protein